MAAAEVVGLSQSATSAALQQVEAALNTQVFERVGRNLVLNDAGRALLPQALSVLEQVRGMEQAFAGQARWFAGALARGRQHHGGQLCAATGAGFAGTQPSAHQRGCAHCEYAGGGARRAGAGSGCWPD